MYIDEILVGGGRGSPKYLNLMPRPHVRPSDKQPVGQISWPGYLQNVVRANEIPGSHNYYIALFL